MAGNGSIAKSSAQRPFFDKVKIAAWSFLKTTTQSIGKAIRHLASVCVVTSQHHLAKMTHYLFF
jgi:hypothetical protein